MSRLFNNFLHLKKCLFFNFYDSMFAFSLFEIILPLICKNSFPLYYKNSSPFIVFFEKVYPRWRKGSSSFVRYCHLYYFSSLPYISKTRKVFWLTGLHLLQGKNNGTPCRNNNIWLTSHFRLNVLGKMKKNTKNQWGRKVIGITK